jgi:HSP20 family protein
MSALATKENPSTNTDRRVEAGKRIDYSAPLVNLHQDADGYTLDVEMPGVGKDGVEITVEDGKLTLVGQRVTADLPGCAVYRERNAEAYRRVFDLDPSIDAGKITARIEQGLLVVHLPKAEAAKPRKVTVS